MANLCPRNGVNAAGVEVIDAALDLRRPGGLDVRIRAAPVETADQRVSDRNAVGGRQRECLFEDLGDGPCRARMVLRKYGPSLRRFDSTLAPPVAAEPQTEWLRPCRRWRGGRLATGNPCYAVVLLLPPLPNSSATSVRAGFAYCNRGHNGLTSLCPGVVEQGAGAVR